MNIFKLFAAVGLISLTACISIAQEETQTRKVSDFSSVDVSEGIKVELTYGTKEHVEVIADADYINRVATEVNGDELDIYIKGNNWKSWRTKILVKVTAKEINSLKSSSGSSLISQNLIESEELKMSVSSGAHLKVAFKAPKASCKSSSGASAKLKGVAKYFSAKASSGSSLSASEVKAIDVIADASSGANVSVYAEKKINADASSGGSIKYSGNPEIVDVDKSSGGSVRKN